MDKAGHINYWISNSKRDWKRAKYCFEEKDYVFSLFCMHLCLEKVCKALWVKNNKSNIPPKIHNLERIIIESNINLGEEDILFLRDMNTFQLEGRYPDYLGKIYKTYNKKFTEMIFNKAKKIKECLEKKV